MAGTGYNQSLHYSKAAMLQRLEAWEEEARTGKYGMKDAAPGICEQLRKQIEQMHGPISDT